MAAKTIRRIRSSLERRQGPARKDPGAVPIADAMEAYWERDTVSFAIPAHSGGRGPSPEVTRWAGRDAVRFDLPMSHGVDTRNRSWQVQSTAQDLFADAVGAKRTLFSTNGSSMNVHVAILGVASPGDALVMARNGHKSAFAGLVLSGARPIYLEPVFDRELQLAHPPTPGELRRVLGTAMDARGVMVFTPSYYGASADVRSLADIAHERDLPLITDDAWGLDYELCGHPDMPEGALARGSDLAIGSVHKTLSGLSQTSVLSVGSDRIDLERLGLCFELEESTSASALLLSSIDGARLQFQREGRELLDGAVRSAQLARERIAAEVPELTVVAPERLGSAAGITGVDPTHLLIETAPIGLTGYEADDWLRDEHHLDFELADHRRIMALVTFAHGEAEVDRLVRALRDLADRGPNGGEVPRLPDSPDLRAEQVMIPRDAFFAGAELVDAAQAIGRVSAELITPYPPGVPVLAPGEEVTDEIVEYLQQFVEAGGFVEGAADQALEQLRVVA
jgi:arginine/lysine/ornithine decarboxylase